MASILCKCGERLQLGLIPNPTEWLTVSDVEFDSLGVEVNSAAMYEKMTHFLKCPKCGRLWFYWNGFSEDPVCYTPEDY